MPDPSRELELQRIDALTEAPDCGRLDGGTLQRLVRAERDIRPYRPEPECRFDPRDGMPILYSMARARRPHDTRPETASTPSERPCPVCEGRTTRIVDVATAGPGVTFINKNLYPILYPGGRPGTHPEAGDARSAPVSGSHFLQWTSNRHDLDLHNVSLAHLETVLGRLAALEATLLHGSDDYPRVPGRSRCAEAHHGYVGIIKNHGHLVGGSLRHGHQQIVHANVRPQRIELDARFLEREGRSVVRFLLEENPPELTLCAEDGVRAVTPYFLRRPLQAILMVEDTRKSYLHELSRRELRGLARALRAMTGALWQLMPRMGRETAYNLVFHAGPIGGLYVELLPWSQEYGGYEQQGLFVCVGTPEHSHQLYQEVIAQ